MNKAAIGAAIILITTACTDTRCEKISGNFVCHYDEFQYESTLNVSPLIAESIQEEGIESFKITGFEFCDTIMVTHSNCRLLSDTVPFVINNGNIITQNGITFPLYKHNNRYQLVWHNVEMELIPKD